MDKQYFIGINLAWSDKSQNNKELYKQYQRWIKECSLRHIKVVRVFLCRWSLNALFDRKKEQVLHQIINYASNHNVEVIIVLNHFVDFLRYYENNLVSDKYTWETYPLKTSSLKRFFKKPDRRYINLVRQFLDGVCGYPNVRSIELFNEIDLVGVPRKELALWCNQVMCTLGCYRKRFQFSLSVAHQSNYSFFQKKCSIPVDIHFYNYPFENAFRNIEYFRERYKSVPTFGEYAKFSESSRLDRCSAQAFFCSGLWGGFFLRLERSPMHWWWKELFQSRRYFRIIKCFYRYKPSTTTVPFTNYELTNLRIKEKSHLHNTDMNKFQKRLRALVRKPALIRREYAAIVKFARKFVYRILDDDVFIRVYQDKFLYIYCEPKNCNVVMFDIVLRPQNPLFNPHAILIDLFTGNERGIQVTELNGGGYRIKKCIISHNHLIKIYNGV